MVEHQPHERPAGRKEVTMTRIGIITTPDRSNDRDFWRWTPAGTTLMFTRTPLDTLVNGDQVTWTPSDEELIQGTRAFVTVRPEVTMFACTSGSFGKGLANERRIRATMERAGAEKALTTSGSVLDALHALGARRVAVATPYSRATTALLGDFLTEAGFEVLSLVNRQPRTPAGLSDMTIEELSEAARAADRPDADVVFVSCAALATYDLIGRLERSLQKPVISSSQATVWAALGAAGVEPTSIDQTLFRHARAVSPARTA
jgi:maleate isomerase